MHLHDSHIPSMDLHHFAFNLSVECGARVSSSSTLQTAAACNPRPLCLEECQFTRMLLRFGGYSHGFRHSGGFLEQIVIFKREYKVSFSCFSKDKKRVIVFFFSNSFSPFRMLRFYMDLAWFTSITMHFIGKFSFFILPFHIHYTWTD